MNDSGRLEAVLALSRLMTAERNLKRLMSLVIAETSKLLGAERSSLFLLDRETGTLWSYVAQNAEIREIRLPVGRGLVGHVARTGETLRIADAYGSEHFDPATDRATGFRTRSVLCVPLPSRTGEMIGVLQVLNKGTGEFDGQDESFLAALASQAGICLDNARLYEENDGILRGLIRSLAAAIDARDPGTAGHSERVTHYSVMIGRAMGMGERELEALEFAAELHDVGKIGIPDDILLKPARLTPEEYAIMKKHAAYTREILEEVYQASARGDHRRIPSVAGAHHEWLDGSGYPYGLHAEQIPMAARIIAVADVYDALTSVDRPYRPAATPEEAIAILREGTPRRFDQAVFDIFVREQLYRLERRKYLRLRADLAIEYAPLAADNGSAKADIQDIGGGGLAFTAREAIAPGAKLVVSVHLPEYAVDLVAEVARCDRIGEMERYKVGIRFLNLSPEAERRLADYLESTPLVRATD